MESVECLVVGAGVIGLAVARALARAGREVIVVESESGIGSGVSSRNSEVIHAGIYYPTGLVKTRLCVDGKAMLYAFCQAFGVPHKRCGKLLVAVNAGEVDKLAALKAQADANGVTDLVWLTGQEARALEPALKAERALLSPSTGIIDAHAYMLALRRRRRGPWRDDRVRNARPRRARRRKGAGDRNRRANAHAHRRRARRQRRRTGRAGARALDRRHAGRQDPAVASRQGQLLFPERAISPFSRLIYPMPTPGGLGVHLTLDLAGQAKFGPDVEWVDAINYDVDPARAASFYAAIRTYWPDLPDGALQPGYAGVRPKIERPGGSTTDFLLQTEKDHGLAGLINLFGIESPGLTASLAIADWVARAV